MIFVADASSFLNAFDFNFENDTYYTTNEIIREIRDFKNKALIDYGFQSGHLKIQDPSPESITEINSISLKKRLSVSVNDKSILALALDFKKQKQNFLLSTDDYSIQSIAFDLKIPFKSIIQNEIKKSISFQLYCPNCNKRFSPYYLKKECDACETFLKKRVIK